MRLTHGTPDKLTPVITNRVYRAYWYPPDHPGLQTLDLAPAGAYLNGEQDLLYWTRDAITAGDFGEPLANSNFDIYIHENALVYFKPNCAQEDTQPRFFLNIYPTYVTDIPARMQPRGFDNRGFNFLGRNVHMIDDSCMAIALLPRYQIERVKTGQQTDAGELWRADITIENAAADPPFDINLDERTLTYAKPHCAPQDTQAKFFLHIFPLRPRDLPADRREHGFDALDFAFADNQLHAPDGNCIAAQQLPPYAIQRIRTGQYTPAGELWRADLNLTREPLPDIRFDISLDERSLIYSKRPCSDQNTRARFFLHIFPARLHDLPIDRREHGFNNHDFNFADNQLQAPPDDNSCIATQPLPAYPIQRIRTGQFARAGHLWQTEITLNE